MVFTGGAMAVTTMVLGKCPAARMTEGPASGWLAKSREQFGAPRELPHGSPMPRWAAPGWYALALALVAAILVFGIFW